MGNSLTSSREPPENVILPYLGVKQDNPTYYSYDALNRVEYEKDALGQVQYYTYDANGNLTGSKDPDGDVTSFTFDELDRRTKVLYPDSTFNYFEYDAVSNLSTARDERGWGYFRYDALNRVTNEKQPDGSEVAHVYDAVGQRTAVKALDSPAYYAYDAVGRMEHADGTPMGPGMPYCEFGAVGSASTVGQRRGRGFQALSSGRGNPVADASAQSPPLNTKRDLTPCHPDPMSS